MARKLTLLFSFFLVAWFTQLQRFLVFGQPKVPCYFIFGDSLVDSGNNNDLNTAAKANYPPYGCDFPAGVNGRFTNGRTIADIIGQNLGFRNFTPPYSTAKNEDLSTGVNYGSGSAGILEDTGCHLGDRVSLERQLQNHESVVRRLALQRQNTEEHLKKCVYIMNIGNNDFINNYLMPNIYPSSSRYNLEQYADVLQKQYTQHLKTLYRLGGRKIAVFGLGMLGCAPAEIEKHGTNGKACVDWINEAVSVFNNRLKPLVNELNAALPNAKFTYINLSSILAPRGGEPLPNKICCQVREDGQCIPNSIPCPNRALSVYFDSFHPTEIANRVLAQRSYTSIYREDASPYDIGQFAREL